MDVWLFIVNSEIELTDVVGEIRRNPLHTLLAAADAHWAAQKQQDVSNFVDSGQDEHPNDESTGAHDKEDAVCGEDSSTWNSALIANALGHKGCAHIGLVAILKGVTERVVDEGQE